MFTGVRHERQSQRKSKGKQDKSKFACTKKEANHSMHLKSRPCWSPALCLLPFRTPCLGVASLHVKLESTSRSKMLLMTKMTPRKGTAMLEHQVHSTLIVQSPKSQKSTPPPQKNTCPRRFAPSSFRTNGATSTHPLDASLSCHPPTVPAPAPAPALASSEF